MRHVVDAFGSNRHVVAMTITNEINLAISPNTSDGAYPRAEQALIRGIIAAHREAQRRGFTQLRFGFTFAYRFNPVTDAAVFTGLRSGGAGVPATRSASSASTTTRSCIPGRATPLARQPRCR